MSDLLAPGQRLPPSRYKALLRRSFSTRHRTESEEATRWIQVQLIAHAMGIYFIAKGLFIARSTSLQAEARNNLARLVELAETASARVEPTSTPETEGQ